MQISHDVSEPGVQRGREARLRAREEDLDGPALVFVTRPTGVVDGGGHLFAPREILAKAIDHALRDRDPAGGGLALEPLLLRALHVGLDVVAHRRHRLEGLLGTDCLVLLFFGLRQERYLRLFGWVVWYHPSVRS